MGHQVDLYYPEAAGGTFVVTSHGSSGSNPSVYTDYDCTNATTSRSISSGGRALFFVKELVDVVVKNSSGTTVANRVEGIRAEAVQLQSQSFTGTSASGGQEAGGKVALDDVMDLIKTSFGAIDGKVRETGTNVDVYLKDALQNVRSNNTQVFNVKQPPYNATGDGVTVDDAAVQAANAALVANGGGFLYFPAGEYFVVQNLTVGSVPTVILGDGVGTSKIVSANSATAVTMLGSGGNKSSIRDITIEVTSTSATPLWSTGDDNSLRDAEITSPTGGTCDVDWGGGGTIAFTKFSNTTAANTGQLNILDSGTPGQSIHVIGCRFSINAAEAISIAGAPNVTIAGNVFENASPTNYIYVGAATDAKIDVTGNTCATPAAAFASSLIRVSAAFAVCIVESGNTITSTTSSSCNPLRANAAMTIGQINTSSKIMFATNSNGISTAPRLGAAVTMCIATGNFTVNAPNLLDGATAAFPFEGAEVCLQVHNNTGGAITWTLAAGYHGQTTNLASATTRIQRFRYNSWGTVAGWIQQGAIVDVT